jgi:predicted dehydrogenase
MKNRTGKKTAMKNLSRRGFLQASAALGAGTALTSCAHLSVAGSDTIRVGLIGCGGRGCGAGITDCAESSPGVELVAMGDLFQDHVDAAPASIKWSLEDRGLSFNDIYKVTPETTFVGFDAYQKVIDCDVDLIILTTPPHFRPEHFRAAVEANKHVFVEKPIAVDPAGVRAFMATADEAKRKGLTVVAGTQMRRARHIMDFVDRIHRGDIGRITGGQVVRCGEALSNWRADEAQPRAEWSEIEYQLRRWLFVTWASGDFVVEQHVHNLDVMNWVMGATPLECLAMGGRINRTGPEYGNVYDHMSAEYLYPDNVRIQYMGRQIDKTFGQNDLRFSGTKGNGYVNFGIARITGSKAHEYDGPSVKPAVQEYADAIDSIRNGKAINEGRQVAESTMTAIMARMSAYTGRRLKWDWCMQASKLDLSPPKDEFGDFPMRPVAIPGITELV